MFRKTQKILTDAANNAETFLKVNFKKKTANQMFDVGCMTLELSAILAASCIDNFIKNGVIKKDGMETALQDYINLVLHYYMKMQTMTPKEFIKSEEPEERILH